MLDQFQTIREFIDRVPHKTYCALYLDDDNFCDCGKQEALNELEAIVAQQADGVLMGAKTEIEPVSRLSRNAQTARCARS